MTKAISEASGMLMLFSMFALLEGTLRMVGNTKPTEDEDPDYYDFGTEDTPKVALILLLASGVGEVLFGLLGLVLALFSLVLDMGSPSLTYLFCIVQFVLGWFVFLTYVIAAPIVAAINAEATDIFSQNEHRLFILLGNMLGSITFCYALQGGQFTMALRLLAAQRGEEVSRGKDSARAALWSLNVLLAAGSTLFVGFLLIISDDVENSTTVPVAAAPPHVVWFPLLSVLAGVIMAVYGLFGFLSIKCRPLAVVAMPWMFVITTLAMLLNFSFIFGIVPGLAPPIPGAAQHVGLVLSVTILPLFHVWKAHQQDGNSSFVESKNKPTYAQQEQPIANSPTWDLGEADV